MRTASMEIYYRNPENAYFREFITCDTIYFYLELGAQFINLWGDDKYLCQIEMKHIISINEL